MPRTLRASSAKIMMARCQARAWLISLVILLQLGKYAGFCPRAVFLVRPSTKGVGRVMGILHLPKEGFPLRCATGRGRQGWRLGMAWKENQPHTPRKESQPHSPQAGSTKVVGGGGYPVTPPFTQRKFMRLSESNTSHRDVIEEMGIVHPAKKGGWLLLTDKRSKLREVFALETSVVRPRDGAHARPLSVAGPGACATHACTSARMNACMHVHTVGNVWPRTRVGLMASAGRHGAYQRSGLPPCVPPSLMSICGCACLSACKLVIVCAHVADDDVIRGTVM